MYYYRKINRLKFYNISEIKNMPKVIKDRQSISLELDNLCQELFKTKLVNKVELLRSQGGGPLVENISGDSDNKKVTFFYYDAAKDCKNVNLRSQIKLIPNLKIIDSSGKTTTNTDKPEPPIVLPMERISEKVWELTVELPRDLCVEYSFEREKKDGTKERIADPINPQQFSYFPKDPNPDSVFDLSPTPKTNLQTRPAIKASELKRYSISGNGSTATITQRDDNYYPMPNERIFTVHFPNNYDATQKYPMRLFLDGKWYLEQTDVPTMFDDDESTINIMLEPKPTGTTAEAKEYRETRTHKGGPTRDKDPAEKDRENEYDDPNMPVFTKFLKETFVSSISKKFNISADPEDAKDNTICGSSLSGFAAGYVGLHCPEIFGNVLIQSAALWKGHELLLHELNSGALSAEQMSQLKKSYFHLEVGSLDSVEGQLIPNRKFADSLREHDIPRNLITRTAGHCFPGWTRFLPEAVDTLRAERSELNAKLDPSSHFAP